MLDRDLAELYCVEVKHLNRQVRRNAKRFPEKFCFILTKKEQEEANCLRCQNGTIEDQRGRHSKYPPYAFTEQGVSMLSAVLKSEIAIEVSIKIIDAFVQMRHFLSKNANIFQKFQQVDQKLIEHDKNFEKVFHAIEDKSIKPKQGIFFNGQMFDAHKFVCELIRGAKNITLIDNYIDENTLTLFCESKAEVRIYTKNISRKLILDLKKYNSQYKPIEIKEFKYSHDRFLIIDDNIYHFGASLKDLGQKWFAFSKMNKESLKIIEKLKNKRC